jgi:hypothetical protein
MKTLKNITTIVVGVVLLLISTLIVITSCDNVIVTTDDDIEPTDPIITPTEPIITPTEGAIGTAFTITDPLARIGSSDLALFYPDGTDPAAGAEADNVTISSDNKILSGNVPSALSEGVQHYVAVRPANDQPSRFSDLPFLVTF